MRLLASARKLFQKIKRSRKGPVLATACPPMAAPIPPPPSRPVLAPPEVRWTSRAIRKGVLKDKWGTLNGNVLQLKDMRSGYWNNRLVAPNVFVYQFPRRRDASLVSVIRLRRDTLSVHLFTSLAARDEYYGEWRITDWDEAVDEAKGEMRLTRVSVQSDDIARRYVDDGVTRERSASEAKHHTLLRSLFPSPEWLVRHEPDALVDLYEPTVVDGIDRSWRCAATRSYTCDFVVARRGGYERFYVESKCRVEDVTDEAVAKARVLRDKMCTRVLFLAGHGDDLAWMDMGDARDGGEEEGEDETDRPVLVSDPRSRLSCPTAV